jgi:AsmA protein
MARYLKFALIGLAALLGLLLLIVAVVASTFNPNDYKPLVIKLVQEKKQRTLTIPGEIKLTFFPKIGADLGKISISEQRGEGQFAAMNSARVSLALLPLLNKELVVDQVKVDGVRAYLKRFKDGHTNFDDLLSKDEKQQQQIKFDIDGVSISDAAITFDDEMQGRHIELTKAELNTGKIAEGKPTDVAFKGDLKSSNPKADMHVELRSELNFELAEKHYALKGLALEVTGQVSDLSELKAKLSGNADLRPATTQFDLGDLAFAAQAKRGKEAIDIKLDVPKLKVDREIVVVKKIEARVKLEEGARAIDASLVVPSFEGTAQGFKVAAVNLDASLKENATQARVKVSGAMNGDLEKLVFSSPQLAIVLDGKQGETVIKGSLTTPLAADFKTQLIELAQINADFTLPNPAGGTLAFAASGAANANLSAQTVAANFNAKLDQSGISAKLGLNKFSPPAYTFDITVDQIDIDRYLAKSPASSGAAKPVADKPAAEKPLDLSALKDLNATGSIRVGALKAANMRASNVRLDVHAAAGKVELNPLSANLYDGTVAGGLWLIASNPPHFSVRQNLTGVQVGPLLKDAIDKDPIDGKGNVALDVTTQGGTVTQLKKGLNGTARLDLRDGAVRGVNVAQALRIAKGKLGAQGESQSGTGSVAEKTDFSEFTGSFKIANGVAHNDDLAVKSPLIRLAGNGDINLGEDRLDYLAKATVVNTLKGQGGPELQALRGVTVPVRLSGPFTAIGYSVDLQGMATDMAKQKIDEKKDELKTKAQDQLKDRLKGLLGK